jgi:hypothetical protein
MKLLTTSAVLLTFLTSTAVAQSNSYHALREKFRGERDVIALHASGGFARTILRIAGERDFKDAIGDVDDIRFIVIPKRAFRANDVTLKGFKKIAREDSFEEIARVKDHGDDVTLMMQTSYTRKHEPKDNRYLLLIESGHEVVVMEIKGYIDPNLTIYKEKIAYN